VTVTELITSVPLYSCNITTLKMVVKVDTTYWQKHCE